MPRSTIRSARKPRLSLALSASLLALSFTSCDWLAIASLARPGVQDQVPRIATAGEPVTGFTKCRHFFPGELPRIPDAQARQARDICYDAFAIMHSATTKTPVFVAERLTREQLEDAGDEERTNRFFADARLPRAERAQLEDYKGSGYDRGHMAPAGDMPTPAAMAQSFSLANMVPQAPENNRRSWAGIEGATRKYVLRAKGPVFVFTGPVYQGKVRTIGAGQVAVPSHLFKLVYDPSLNKAWAHWIENSDTARAGKPISYGELVRRTGIEFLPGASPHD